MSVPLSRAQALYRGIKANSPALVAAALDAGADPSVDHDGTTVYPPLSRAIDNCSKSKYVQGREDSVMIVDLLLEAGASKSDRNHALQVAADHQSRNNSYTPTVARAIQKIVVVQQTVTTDIPHVPVACTVLQMLKQLLFSQDFSDVVFIFEDDDTKLYAHRCVLAAASPYFDGYFKGPWAKKKHKDGTWKTKNPLEVMKAILTFIYTGKFKKSILKTHPAEMLDITNQYQLWKLKEATENSFIGRITQENVKAFLQKANLYNADKLKSSCFGYVNRHPQLLVDPSFTSLGQEDPNLWSELCSFLDG